MIILNDFSLYLVFIKKIKFHNSYDFRYHSKYLISSPINVLSIFIFIEKTFRLFYKKIILINYSMRVVETD